VAAITVGMHLIVSDGDNLALLRGDDGAKRATLATLKGGQSQLNGASHDGSVAGIHLTGGH
jgi:hypothetical protein